LVHISDRTFGTYIGSNVWYIYRIERLVHISDRTFGTYIGSNVWYEYVKFFDRESIFKSIEKLDESYTFHFYIPEDNQQSERTSLHVPISLKVVHVYYLYINSR